VLYVTVKYLTVVLGNFMLVIPLPNINIQHTSRTTQSCGNRVYTSETSGGAASFHMPHIKAN